MSLLSRLAVQAARAYGILSSNPNNVPASYLVVAGGGGGGGGRGSGAGAGGYRTGTSTLSILNTYTVVVGSGGAGGIGQSGVATSGIDSSIAGTGFTTFTSSGGGGGKSVSQAGSTGNSGGSGSGGNATGSGTGGAGNTPSTSPSQGSNGGNGIDSGSPAGGGGGGSSAVGGNASNAQGGVGGAGTASSISGSSVTYAGGGGGGAYSGSGGAGGSGGGGAGSASTTGTAGTVNLGGGGGGGGDSQTGGAGGSGVVIISYTSATPKFTGGTLTTSGGNQIHTFTSSGTLSPLTPVTASYLVVAGGGGSGSGASSTGGAGGGAGGLLTSSTTLYSGATYVVTVGAGGAGSPTLTSSASSGGNSVLSGTGLTTVTATGGGYGATYTVNSNNGANGGSGGGSEYSGTAGTGTSGQGYAGGGSTTSSNYGCGGGGGSGGVGATGTTTASGNGGIATASSISGTSTYYAGGGGGGFYSTSGFGLGGGTATVANKGGAGDGSPTGVVGNAGVANTGGGAGGAGGGNTAIGAAGGSGTVIISYAGSQVFNGGLVTSSGGNTIHTFNATGALTPLTNNLNNSLRFRASASAYLTRTNTSKGNSQKFTYSAWIKRGTLSGNYIGLLSSNSSAGAGEAITFQSSDTIRFWISGAADGDIVTTQVFRDPSAWYHIVIAVDTTQATAANRVKMYVNGNQITSFSTASYPAQNYNFTSLNTATYPTIIGSAYIGYFDGYMADINFVDGQQLEPYYFGNNDSYGNWKPIKYTGMYGTNGYYLTFGNTTSTTTLGYDSSPNGNNFTTSGISVTAGVTYDAMLDVPTNTSATVANYPTWNPLFIQAGGTVSNANLTYAGIGASGSGTYTSIGATMAVPTTGKWYWEIKVTQAGGAVGDWWYHGIMLTTTTSAASLATAGAITHGDAQNTVNSGIYNETVAVRSNQTDLLLVTGDTVQVAYDAGAAKLWFGRNNQWYDATTGFTGDPANGTNPTIATVASGTWVPYMGGHCNLSSGDANFGQRPFTYTPPTGYVALNTYNLPTPTILQGNLYMDATLYTGTGATQSITNAGAFKPDFVWTKARSAAIAGLVYDSVRGATKYLQTNSTGAEGTGTDSLTAFASNGFTVGADTSTTGVNQNGTTYVGWQWQAGQGSSSSNTNGSITSTVSANTTAGFSIVTYTGTGANATVGHGLGVAPKMIIFKSRSLVADWDVYHTSLGATKSLFMNKTVAADTGISYFNNTSPTSSVFSLGYGGDLNTNASTNVAYCFAEIAGFSKFGSYTGNGSSDGPFIYLGFRPKFIMIKRTDSTSNWFMESAPIPGYNQSNLELYAESSSAEGSTTGGGYDFLSNGFKVRIGSAYNPNVSSGTYIYMAFAENPFKNSNSR
jgi:hypothetical protein